MSFSWLRDVADGLDIDQAQVDRERGVIMSEYVGSRGADGATSPRTATELPAAGLLGPKRAPIGLKDIIKTVNADTIRGFYASLVPAGDTPSWWRWAICRARS